VCRGVHEATEAVPVQAHALNVRYLASAALGQWARARAAAADHSQLLRDAAAGVPVPGLLVSQPSMQALHARMAACDARLGGEGAAQ
jgi:hypothetical protein